MPNVPNQFLGAGGGGASSGCTTCQPVYIRGQEQDQLNAVRYRADKPSGNVILEINPDGSVDGWQKYAEYSPDGVEFFLTVTVPANSIDIAGTFSVTAGGSRLAIRNRANATNQMILQQELGCAQYERNTSFGGANIFQNRFLEFDPIAVDVTEGTTTTPAEYVFEGNIGTTTFSQRFRSGEAYTGLLLYESTITNPETLEEQFSFREFLDVSLAVDDQFVVDFDRPIVIDLGVLTTTKVYKVPDRITVPTDADLLTVRATAEDPSVPYAVSTYRQANLQNISTEPKYLERVPYAEFDTMNRCFDDFICRSGQSFPRIFRPNEWQKIGDQRRFSIDGGNNMTFGLGESAPLPNQAVTPIEFTYSNTPGVCRLQALIDCDGTTDHVLFSATGGAEAFSVNRLWYDSALGHWRARIGLDVEILEFTNITATKGWIHWRHTLIPLESPTSTLEIYADDGSLIASQTVPYVNLTVIAFDTIGNYSTPDPAIKFGAISEFVFWISFDITERIFRLYTFEEQNLSTVYDCSGNGEHISLTNGGTFTTHTVPDRGYIAWYGYDRDNPEGSTANIPAELGSQIGADNATDIQTRICEWGGGFNAGQLGGTVTTSFWPYLGNAEGVPTYTGAGNGDGLVPDALVANDYVLNDSGIWVDVNGLLDIFAGAGTTGIVPDPGVATGLVLDDSGNWVPNGGAPPPVFAGPGTTGLVPDPVTNDGQVLRTTGVWEIPAASKIAANSNTTGIGTSPVVVKFDTSVRENHPGMNDTVNSTITVPHSSLYHVDVSTEWLTSANQGLRVFIRVNGVNRSCSGERPSSAGNVIGLSDVLELTAGDVLDVTAQRLFGGGTEIILGNPICTRFAVTRFA